MASVNERRDPWLKFFHTDWQADEAVQMCSLAARGLWLELILFMHRAEPYGHLIINGVAPTNEDLIRRLRPKSKREFLDAMAELRRHHVYSVTDNGVIYCRRMLRKIDKIRANRENGLLGGRPKNPTQNPTETQHVTQKEPTAEPIEKPPEADADAEARSRGRSRPPRQLSGASKHPLFTGQRLTVFDWFLEKAAQILGTHLDAFDIHAWFYDVDAAAVKAGKVLPDRDGGRWLAAELVAEAVRRGLPIASANDAKVGGAEDPYARFTTAWQCTTCGEIHEGRKVDKGKCLKKAAS